MEGKQATSDTGIHRQNFGWRVINMEGGSSLGRMGVLERETGGMGSLKVKLYRYYNYYNCSDI